MANGETAIQPLKIGPVEVGPGRPFAVIAGPCVIESEAFALKTAENLARIGAELNVGIIYKSSFDKANRTSLRSFRGPGLDEGLRILRKVKEATGLPLLSDVHEPWQADKAAETLDVLQIPAFLCRQTDLLTAAARTGKVVNIKKGQFLAPWDARHIVEKVRASGNDKVILTERGASFGYNRLVVDFTGFPILRRHALLCFDATHSVQQPGGRGDTSGGNRELVPYLARAAVACGVDLLFFEVHPDPDRAPSDGPNMVRLGDFAALLSQLQEIERACTPKESAAP